MEFLPLTSEQRESFQADGFLILRSVLSPGEVARLIEAGDRLIASDRQDNRQRSAGGLYDGFRNTIAMDDAFIPLLMHPRVFPLVVQLMSPNLSLLTSHLIYKHPNVPGTSPDVREPGWHRDILYTPEDLGHDKVPMLDIKAAFYFTDLSEPNCGATLFARGSQHFKSPLHIPPGKSDPDTAVEPRLHAGDCVLFENRTWHAGAVNLSGRTRKGIMMGYGYSWMRPFDYFQQPGRLLDQVDDIGKQLFGGLKDKNGHFVPGGINDPLRKWWKANGLPKYLPWE
jgi:ectoine hydroxylase-related dioxygenase (phytanoyl-CoA dioxygenase family)